MVNNAVALRKLRLNHDNPTFQEASEILCIMSETTTRHNKVSQTFMSSFFLTESPLLKEVDSV